MADALQTQKTPTAEPNTAQAGQKEGPPPIADNLDNFIQRIDSLQETLPLAMLAIAKARNSSGKRFADFLTTKTLPGPEENERIIPEEEMPEFMRLRRQLDISSIAERSISRSFVVAMISDYDVFLSGLLRILFRIQPGLMNATEKTFSYEDLAEFQTIDSVREHMVEKHIEGVLRESHTEQFKWMENKFGLPLRKDLKSWPEFIEVTERRNIFVHNDGIVNSQYLYVCKDQGVDCGEAKKGNRLGVDRKYFTHAHATIFEIAAKLSHVLWRKMLPDDRDKADSHLAGHLLYELLLQERYKLAAVMGDFAATTFKKFASDHHSKMLAVNRAQAHKWLGDEKVCHQIVDAEDWSAAKDDFRLCVAALKDEPQEFIAVMRTMGTATESPGKKGLREWPMFKEMRKRQDVQEAFVQVYGEPMNVVPTSESEAGKAAEPTAPAGPVEAKVH